jgi:hypothetical protein
MTIQLQRLTSDIKVFEIRDSDVTTVLALSSVNLNTVHIANGRLSGMKINDMTVEVKFEDIAQYVEDMCELPNRINFNHIDEIEVDHETKTVFITVRRVEENLNPWKGVLNEDTYDTE